MPGPPRVFSREFKEAAVRRILAGERVQALAA
jgi:transposase-like protein